MKEKLKRELNRARENKLLTLMILPGFIFMIVFNYVPMYGLYIAFTTQFSPFDTVFTANYVGFQNFIDFLTDPYFLNVLKNTFVISFGKLLIGFPLGIIFALMINELRQPEFKKWSQTVSYLPHFLSWVILGGMLISWLSTTGIVNEMLMALNIVDKPVAFLTTASYYKPIAIISDVWKEIGWSTILYLAAMTSIDPGLYEASTLDGAGKLKQTLHVTLPGIRTIIALNLVLSVGALLNSNLDQTLILQNSLNVSASEVLDSYVLKIGLIGADYSYATAIGLFRSVVALVLVLGSNKIASKINDKSIF